MKRTNHRYVMALVIVAGYYANATYAKKTDITNLTTLVQDAVNEIHEMRADLRAHMNSDHRMPYPHDFRTTRKQGAMSSGIGVKGFRSDMAKQSQPNG